MKVAKTETNDIQKENNGDSLIITIKAIPVRRQKPLMY